MNVEAWCHVEIGPCHATWCEWTGFHWHWNVQRFRSVQDLNRFDVMLMNEEMT